MDIHKEFTEWAFARGVNLDVIAAHAVRLKLTVLYLVFCEIV
jgi:hypothetical protein